MALGVKSAGTVSPATPHHAATSAVGTTPISAAVAEPNRLSRSDSLSCPLPSPSSATPSMNQANHLCCCNRGRGETDRKLRPKRRQSEMRPGRHTSESCARATPTLVASYAHADPTLFPTCSHASPTLLPRRSKLLSLSRSDPCLAHSPPLPLPPRMDISIFTDFYFFAYILLIRNIWYII